MSTRCLPLAVLALAPMVSPGYGHAGEQGSRLLRYKPASPLSYVIIEGEAPDRILVVTIDSSDALPKQDKLVVDFRAADISLRRGIQQRRIVMTARGEVVGVEVSGQRTVVRRPANLPRGTERVLSERALWEAIGLPLLPEKKVRPGDRWVETFHLAKSMGEGTLLVPVNVACRYERDTVLQRRKCAILSFKLSGELGLPRRGGTVKIAAEGQLTFDYENGCDVEVHKKFTETTTPSRGGGLHSRTKVKSLVKRLSEIPLLSPSSTGQVTNDE